MIKLQMVLGMKTTQVQTPNTNNSILASNGGMYTIGESRVVPGLPERDWEGLKAKIIFE